jgi:hypothetical protein
VREGSIAGSVRSVGSFLSLAQADKMSVSVDGNIIEYELSPSKIRRSKYLNLVINQVNNEPVELIEFRLGQTYQIKNSYNDSTEDMFKITAIGKNQIQLVSVNGGRQIRPTHANFFKAFLDTNQPIVSSFGRRRSTKTSSKVSVKSINKMIKDLSKM